jgi:hypothetical protein
MQTFSRDDRIVLCQKELRTSASFLPLHKQNSWFEGVWIVRRFRPEEQYICTTCFCSLQRNIIFVSIGDTSVLSYWILKSTFWEPASSDEPYYPPLKTPYPIALKKERSLQQWGVGGEKVEWPSGHWSLTLGKSIANAFGPNCAGPSSVVRAFENIHKWHWGKVSILLFSLFWVIMTGTVISSHLIFDI